MAPLTPMATTPYDYATAQALLKQRYGLAQALLNTQSPSPGQMNHAKIGGAEYSFYVPNTAGAVSAALSKALGGYELNKANQSAEQDVQNQNNSVLQALANLNPTVTDSQDVTEPLSPSEQSNLNAADAPSANAPGLSGLDVSKVPYQVPVYSGPSSNDMMRSILQLERAGPGGQGLAAGLTQRMFTPPKFITDPKTGVTTAVDPYSGQTIRDNIGGEGGNPDLVKEVLALRPQIHDAAGLPYLNDLERRAGMPLSTPQSLGFGSPNGGNQVSPVQAAQIPQIKSVTADNNARVPLIQAQTGEAVARTGEANASAASTTQATGLAGVKATQGANNDVASLTYNYNRTIDGLNIIKQLESQGALGGKPGATWRDAQTYFGSDPKWAAARSYMAQANVMSMIQSLHNAGRLGQSEFKVLSSQMENGNMPLKTLEYLFRQTAALQDTQLFNAKTAAGQTANVANGATPGLHAAPVTPAPVPQISQGDAPPASALKPGVVTHFSNGTSWTIDPNGQPVQVH